MLDRIIKVKQAPITSSTNGNKRREGEQRRKL
jgi:hypothetical protein